MKKKVITSAILTIALALSLLLGATYALFTSESRNSIDITSGKVSVEAVVDEASIQTKQLNRAYATGLEHTFAGGVEFVENQVVLEKLVPGDGVKFTVDITNESNIAVKYRVKISSVAPVGVDPEDSQLLFSALNFNVGGSDFSGVISYKSNWQDLAVTDQPENITFEIELPVSAGNEYQDLSTSIVLVVEAIQGNAEVTGDEEFIRYKPSVVLNQDGIKLDIPEGIFEPGQVPTLEITKPDAPTNFVVKQDNTNQVLVQTLDIKLPGIAEDNEKLITVTIPVDKHMPEAVVYYNDGTQLEPMATTSLEIDGEYFIQFTTTHFSEYILVEEAFDVLIINKEGKHTIAYDNLNNIMDYRNAAALDGSTIKLNKDARVVATILIDSNIVLDLNGYDIIAQEATSSSNDQIFQVRKDRPLAHQFTITNSQDTGGNIVLNNRKLLLSYKPVSIEKVTIKQFDENSTDAVKSGKQSEVVLSYDLLTLEGVKVLIENSTSHIFNARSSLVIKNSEITIDEHHTSVFNLVKDAEVPNKFEVDGLKLFSPKNGAEFIIGRYVGVQIIINNMDIDTTSTRSDGLSLFYRSDGSEGVTIQINSGEFSGIAKMNHFSSDPSVLQVNGGTFDFNPEAFVDSNNYVAVQEAGKWVVQSK